ncbi:hypothetical protein QBC47DRAFT_85811 [Echria macrotheca]|uniref:NACHT domain-containing protein n=1 Tax=Echria macrotheca TaxID=438768 RepID=A0AAJ0F1G8_9PEZI|nr:hypothetical protein QBC47DRAFT_85811 [Echria macrotheca]
MEATAALGIAGNVVQFLEFGQKLCRTFSQIHRSATGVTEHNNDTEILIHSFASNVGVISGDLAKYCAHLGATKGPDGGMNSGQGGDQMQAVIRGCGEVAVDLLGRLDKLKSCSGLPVGKRKAILTTVKAMWKGKELEDLELKLSRFRKELQWIVVVSLRRSLDLLESRQKDQFEILQTSMSDILTRLIQVNMTPLPAWPTAASLASPSLQPGVHERLGNSYASGLAEVEELALKSLAFPVMPHRETEIADAEAATFDWIFAEPQHRDRSWSNFSEWLTGDNSARLYWINGKAGSGKSTLMKYLVRHAKTKAALQAWAGSTKLLLASFFFWHNGHEIQRSQIGLIRSLLYACLKNHRELIPVVLSGTEALDANDLSDYWNLPKLREALERLVSQTRFDLKFVFFVDGLDEYAGTHGEIADILKRISLRGNVKVCVSSRPLLVFDHAFDGLPHLVLQNLTFNDITFYVNNKLGDNERMKTLEKYEPGLRASLTDAIVRKASGVFLWVHLVVKSLLDGLGNYDVGDDLRRRLDDLPEELEALYWLMIQKVKPAWYLEEGNGKPQHRSDTGLQVNCGWSMVAWPPAI